MSLTKEQLKDCYLDIQNAVEDIQKDPNQQALMELQDKLNRFFTGTTCDKVIYTMNTDKMFFGLFVMPKFHKGAVVDYLLKTERVLVDTYYLELDSKLFEPLTGLTSAEITAFLIHDIGSLVGDSGPFETFKALLNKYLTDHHIVLKFSDSYFYSELLSYAVRDSLRKLTSIFEVDGIIENTAAELIDWCDWTGLIKSGLKKLSILGYLMNRFQVNKLVTLDWILRIYTDVAANRVPALKSIQRCQELTPSTIERKELQNLGKVIMRIDDDSLLESAVEDEMYHMRQEFTKGKHCGQDILTEQKQDYIDILMAMDADDDNTFLPIALQQINTKMTMIQDYVDNTPMDKKEFKQWGEMFRELGKKRDALSKAQLFLPQQSLKRIFTDPKEDLDPTGGKVCPLCHKPTVNQDGICVVCKTRV